MSVKRNFEFPVNKLSSTLLAVTTKICVFSPSLLESGPSSFARKNGSKKNAKK